MLVYRIEHNENRLGPYNNSVEINWDVWYFSSDKHPKPCYDKLLLEEFKKRNMSPFVWDEYSFGFSSLNQAVEWFDKKQHWEALSKAGFVLSKYECTEALVGEKQVMFEMHNSSITTFVGSTLISYLPLNVWFNDK